MNQKNASIFLSGGASLLRYLLFVVGLSLLLVGCGGGGGNELTTDPANSEWDSLIWGQDNWG